MIRALRALRALPLLLLPLAACADDDTTPLADVTVMSDHAVFGDAAISPDGSVGFFAGRDGDTAVVARLAADGTPTDLVRGAPLLSARGLVAIDASSVYVADETGDAIYEVGAGAPRIVDGTSGTHPRAVELDAAGTLYWVGQDGGAPAVFSLAGGSRHVVAKDARFTALGGIDVAGDGTVYVTDDGGSVFEVSGATVSVLAAGVTLGDPAGIALTGDDRTVLVSSLDATGHSQVLLLDASTGSRSTFDDVIGANTGSGGLHRAQDATDRFIWCGSTVGNGGPGTVFRVDLR